jgi:effector-binding domain-containing protein
VLHEGGYGELAAVYGRLEAWIAGHGRAPGSGPWESYLNTPVEEPDPAKLRTEVCWPLR